MRLLFSIFIFLFACGCKAISSSNHSAPNPPGTVKLTDNLYIDKTEVANVHWREFLFYVQRTHGTDSKEFINSSLDTLVWHSLDSAVELSEFYHRHPSFNNSPAVGMSYEQVLAFCEWRTNAVNFLLSKKPNGKFKKVRYRLPTVAEWEMAAADGLELDEYPFGLKKVFNKKGEPLFHFFRPHKLNDASESVKTYTSSILSFQPNQRGIYQLQGNVSEIVAEKGIAKGGNFMLLLDSCKIQINHQYLKPEAWLGFRCVCEIVE